MSSLEELSSKKQLNAKSLVASPIVILKLKKSVVDIF